jgi:hypothetical protein
MKHPDAIIFKIVHAVTLLIMVLALASCSMLYSAWGAAYHHQGGFGKTYPAKTKPVPLIRP